jgi:hypothetical protein
MHPYSELPDCHFWRRFVSNTPWRDIPFHRQPKFHLSTADRIGTAGSCFAQRIAEHLSSTGITPFFAETAHPLLNEFGGDTSSYRQFSARYGNIYTARQLLELFNQAFGLREPILDFVEQDGRWFDLLRPSIQKEGFQSNEALKADRLYHLTRVRHLFENASVFIFTLGLTEAWINVEADFTYPSCPGTTRGEFVPSKHIFKNFTVADVSSDLQQLIDRVRNVNPTLKFILTVSPVPLVATKSDNNVLIASSYSKSVLRAAAGEIEAANANVDYFPSYEIISHPASFGQYLDSDLREVTPRGVAHVMSCFISSYLSNPDQPHRNKPLPAEISEAENTNPIPSQPVNPIECEEIFNEPNVSK